MAASNRWNLSRDYYDILPADSEMDGTDPTCGYCDGRFPDPEYFILEDELCDCETAALVGPAVTGSLPTGA